MFLNIGEHVPATSSAHRQDMATSNYDVNVQLALVTTAEYEGDLDSALGFLGEAHRVAREARDAQLQVYWFTVRFHARHTTALSFMKHASLRALTAVV